MQYNSISKLPTRSSFGRETVIHPSCIIEPNSFIGQGVVIGAGTRVLANAYIAPGTNIGENNLICPNAVIGTSPQTRENSGHEGYVDIGNNNQIRENVSIHSGDAATKTVIGDGNIFMTNSHVAHHCQVGSNVTLGHMAGVAGHCLIEDEVTIGSFGGVKQFSRIGAGSYLTPGSLLHKSLPPWCIAQGVKAYLVCPNVEIAKKSGVASADILLLKNFICAWRTKCLSAAIKNLKNRNLSGSMKKFLHFVSEANQIVSPFPCRGGQTHGARNNQERAGNV